MKPRRVITEAPVAAHIIFWIIGALLLVAAPHLLRVPLWISAASVLLGAWRVWGVRRPAALPGKAVRVILMFAALAGVLLTYGTVFGRDAGTALLLVMLSLKLLEMRTRRDVLVVIFLGYFLVLTQFLYSQSIFIGAYLLLVVLAITATLIGLHRQGAQLAPMANLRLASVLLLQALPLMLALYVLFPRISGPLIGLPKDAFGAGTGLDDEMAPGRISDLRQSGAVAFRVEFSGAPPDAGQRYWRGPVLWLTDGVTWSPGAGAANAAPVQIDVSGEPVNYDVTLEAHNRDWLFALDIPATVPDIGRITEDLQLLAHEPVKSRVRYKMTSYTQYRNGVAAQNGLRRALQLPPDANPRLRALAGSWRAEIADDEKLMQRALDFFRDQPFYYTLKPPLLVDRPHPMDDFLFSTRRGFCEHYSSAFAMLMRAAGIPARVVLGYQGGEMNPLGNYMIVRQSDAHAWAEVWLGEKGWVRVDPTGVIPPARVEINTDAAAQVAEVTPLIDLAQAAALVNAWQQLRFGWDAVNNTWNLWVLGYSAARQQQLFTQLGLDSWTKLGLGLLVALGLPFLFVAAHMLLRRSGRRDPAVALYQRYCNKLARARIVRRPSEGALDFALRVARLRPDLATQTNLITALYCALRYSPTPPAHALRQLRQFVQAFRA